MIEEIAFNFFMDLSFIALPILLLVRKERSLQNSLHALGFKPIKAGALLKSSAKIFLLLLAASIWLGLAITFLNLNDLGLVSQSLEEAKAVLPLFFWVIVVRVVSEEVFFRGFLVNATGVVPSSALFALLHIGYGSVAEVVGAFALGLILAKAFQLNKNLHPNILAHIAYNAIAIFGA